MTQPEIRFDDGAAYEKFMGIWSRLVGDIFLDWLAPRRGLEWLDVGCGNGAFTERLVERAGAASVVGIDPSEAQLEFARQRHVAGVATFLKGDAQDLPVTAGSFDAAAMALVIFFVKEPAKGVAEMVRAMRPGGSVSAYAWDLTGGGFPLQFIHEELAEMGVTPLLPPSPEAAQLDSLKALWGGAGLTGIETRVITVERSFDNFDDLWAINMAGPLFTMQTANFSAEQRQTLRERVHGRLAIGADGRITCQARAHAVQGRMPG